MLVDIASNPFISRRESLTALAELAREHRDEPLIIMADFNTPPESVHFGLLREDFSNAFETAGNGFSGTWPLPAPVLALDQIWSNGRVAVNECHLVRSWRSDHRSVLASLSVR
jgi:endonuclease/exonuclease/phosphatase (EEP) superfamily protein YafD